MKLNFKIHENYLLYHTLANSSTERFSSARHRKDIVALQNLAWDKSQGCYNVFTRRIIKPSDLVDFSVYREIPKFVEKVKMSKEFKKIVGQTNEYLNFCRKQWDKNYTFAAELIGELTGFGLKKIFDVYITHPSLKNGRYVKNNIILWGHNEDWPNYAIVYLWHEILHSYFGKTDLDHTLLEFITDEELRTSLNKTKYPPFVGHKYLHSLKEQILPHWRKYLKQKSPRDIMEFKEKLIKRHKIPEYLPKESKSEK